MHSVPRDPTTWRYPPIEAYKESSLKVSALHSIYFEESGNPEGKPVIFVHGGPGGGTEPDYRRYFHPEKYRIILFDQRGSGKSTPYASIEENTTWDLVSDMEAIRTHLGIERWQVFGGSWGSTLSLAYAVNYPACVTELVLRGIFLGMQREVDWLYQFGASEIFPDAWEDYKNEIPEDERHDFVTAYHKRLTASDLKVQLSAAKAWSVWEGRITRLMPNPEYEKRFEDETFALAFARIECHYFFNRLFFKGDDYLLKNIHKIRHIPAVIVHGRYDICCAIRNAYELNVAWPESELVIVPDAGHSAAEPGIARALVAATDRFASLR